MLSYSFYKGIHLLGLFMAVFGLGGRVFLTLAGVPKKTENQKRIAILHGVGLTLALFGGFGMAARIQLEMPYPGWFWGKAVIWLFLGGAMAMAGRKKKLASRLVWALPLAVFIALWLVITKPF